MTHFTLKFCTHFLLPINSLLNYTFDYVLYTNIDIYIQGDSGGICNTLGNDSMCDSKQKSSYGHGSDFERLPSYGTRADLVARINNAFVRIKDRRHELRRATRSTLQRVHKSIEVGGGIFEHLL